MLSIKKNQLYLISILITFVFLNYFLVIGNFLLFDKEKLNYNPIDYNVHESNGDNGTDKIQTSYINSSTEMFSVFEEHNFNINSFLDDSFGNMVIFSSLPDDFLKIEPVSVRKDLFIKVILPIIFIENEKILKERKKILEWWTEMDGELIAKEFWPDWLLLVCKEYSYDGNNVGNLLMRVDIVPISMALAQSAIESGWGTSRYAREGNAIFGQYTYNKELGLLPKERPKDKNHLIRKFNDISQSVNSYIKNLNTHQAYKKFREFRKKMRMEGEVIDGSFLLETMVNYSERKEDYIKDVKEMIFKNNFQKFDKVYK